MSEIDNVNYSDKKPILSIIDNDSIELSTMTFDEISISSVPQSIVGSHDERK